MNASYNLVDTCIFCGCFQRLFFAVVFLCERRRATLLPLSPLPSRSTAKSRVILFVSCIGFIFITARIRRMTGGYIFSLSTLCGGGSRSSLGHGGGPDPTLDGGGSQSSLGWGGTQSSLGWGGSQSSLGRVRCHLLGGTPSPGTPLPPGIASTCYGYAAGGVPLAFTQEDFLVFYFVSECPSGCVSN